MMTLAIPNPARIGKRRIETFMLARWYSMQNADLQAEVRVDDSVL
jgi:hypothetical protein